MPELALITLFTLIFQEIPTNALPFQFEKLLHVRFLTDIKFILAGKGILHDGDQR